MSKSNTAMQQRNSQSKVLLPMFFALLLAGLFTLAAHGQALLPKEQVRMHTPKTLYFSGEKLWFEAQVMLGGQPTASQVLYAELVDRNSLSIVNVKVPLQEGQALNFIQLPEQIPSDNYLLRVYTRISPYLDVNQGIAQQFVTVVNPRIPPKVAMQGTGRMKQEVGASYRKGAALEFPSSAGSTAVGIASGISIANPFLVQEQESLSSAQLYAPLNPQPLLPELFGHLIQAKVPTADTTLTYFLSLHGDKSALFTDHADAQGRLVFDAGGLRHWERLILQLENGDEMPGLELVSPLIITSFKADFDFPQLTMSEEDLPYLQPLLKAALVQNYYWEEADRDSLETITGFVADYAFDLDAYTRFDAIETILREYVPSVSVRLKDKKKVFRLINEANKSVFDENPLILVDAMPVFDADLLASFNPKLLQRLEVLNREFYLNDRTYPGVLSFSSYTNNFGLFPLAPAARFFDYQGVQPRLLLDKHQWQEPVTDKRIPDWRIVLFWGVEGEKAITQAPNLAGEFVYWERVWKDGSLSTQRTFFQVKD
jgi:hypothetical protein